jgi:hypothetical protein
VAAERITRRRAIGTGVAALAAGALAPSPALARGPSLFELDLEAEVRGTASASASPGWRTTRVLRAPRRFDLLGLRWAAGSAGVEAQVRTRTHRGEWSGWLALHAGGDHAPDGAGGRVPGTEPAWTDSADLFQLRLRGSARGLRARFVRAKPAASVARAVTGRLRRRAGARASQALPGAAPPIISRAEWGAASVPPRSGPSYGQVQLGFLHHTVTANAYGPADSAAIVLGIARYHRDSNGWNDIGYNFLVDQYGQVFEGRAGGIELPVVGAQAQGYNSVSTGVACLGDFQAVPQTDAGIAALCQLLAWKFALHGVPAEGQVTVTSAGGPSNRYPAGTPVALERLSGHRDGDLTTCPGDGLYAQLPPIRAEVARRIARAGTSALTVRAASRRVRYPTPVALSGQLRFADGSPASGVPLELQYQVAGGAWQSVTQTSCGPDGGWAAQAEVPVTSLVRAQFAGDAGRPPLASAPVAVTVLPRVTLKLSSRRVGRRGAIRAMGIAAPLPADGRVTVVLERRVRSRWVVVSRKRIKLRRGGFDTRLRPKSAGLHRVGILVPGAAKRARVRVTRAA